MVESNKILTVSYGTFSCTLEGFDDSFSTMKAIAEYFRDLAADDRYFGAEPPTPDADMLARIAEREITRRVEARMESSGLVLRATGAIGSDTYVAPSQPTTAQSDASRVEAIRAERRMQRAAAAPVQTDDSVSEAVATAPAAGDITGPGALLLAASGPAMAPDAADAADDGVAVAAQGHIDRHMPPAPARPAADSVAAKLQRIRAVVGRASTGLVASEMADYAEDLNVSDMADDAVVTFADDTDEQDNGVLDRLMGTESAFAEADFVADPVPAPAMTEDLTEDFGGIDMAALRAATAAPAVAAPHDDAFDDLMPDAMTDMDLDEDDLDADLADDFDDEIEASDDADEPLAEPEMAPVTNAEPMAEAVEERAPAPIRARVIRMKRADFDRAVEEGTLEEEVAGAPMPADNVAALDGLDDLEQFASAPTAPHDLDQDEEDDLMKELAEVEADFAGSDDLLTEDDLDEDEDEADSLFDLDDEGVDDEDDLSADLVAMDDEDEDADMVEPETDPRSDRANRAKFDVHPDDDEASMSRILSQTDAELNEPESNRRRAAIAHLKAAVAATEAARRMGEPAAEDEEAENAFRDDLSQVVRPRRAEVSERRTERPRPAPLKLVASQRIDVAGSSAVSAPAAVAPVRPRRVMVEEAAVPAAAASQAQSFGEFAEEVGARDLGELLEAAAAYTSFVEGLEDFSRPQLMKKVREASGDDFSREDGLRSFGTLLRQGRIERLRNGRFQVSEQTRYRPEPRAAHG